MELLNITASVIAEKSDFIERRHTKGLQVADIGAGFLRFVEPEFIRELWYMLTDDNVPFLPIQFR